MKNVLCSQCSFICFDREHPESAALCAAGGAELVLHPTACGFDMSTIKKLAARAMYNGLSIAMANFGNSTDQPESRYWGHSALINATGDFVGGDANVFPPTAASPAPPPQPSWMQTGEGIYVAEFDIGAQRQYRESVLGKALHSHHLEPALCRVPLPKQQQQGNFDVHRMWL
eukprot:SAG11_NODE_2803_length_2954_cov_1.849737_3_plen_172_part_00